MPDTTGAAPGVDADRARELGGAPLNTDEGFGHRPPEPEPEVEPQVKEVKQAPKKEAK
jgi:hypothetical protein